MKGMNAHVNTRSSMVSTGENTNAEKNKNLVTGGALGKGRTPFSDISNSFQRPNIQQTKKSALIQAHSKPSLVEARTSKPVISKPVIQPKQQLVQKSNQLVEEIVVETPVEGTIRLYYHST
jgi:hypothetical protein